MSLSVDWPSIPVRGTHDLNDLSFGRLTMTVAGINVTAWRGDNGSTGDSIEVGLYHLAEWIALNWWALLYEPKKGDGSDPDEYRHRHWLGTARNGFALPDLWITPAGPRIEITAEEQYLRSARATFLAGTACTADRDSVCAQLTFLVEDVLGRMAAAGASGTIAEEAWALVQATEPDQEMYCRLIGSLGLSPYDDNGQVDHILEAVSEVLHPNVLADLCQAVDSSSLRHVSDIVTRVVPSLTNGRTIDLSILNEISVPVDAAPKPWRRGVDAANRVRGHLRVSARDPRGVEAFFDALHLDTSASIQLPLAAADNGRVTAAIQRSSDPEMRVALIESGEAQRRFTATRAVFLGWLEGGSTSRLVTGAKTRDQQASRAFAAEMLAPHAYIKARAGGRTLRSRRVDEIADELGTSSAVVRYQASNNHIHVTD